MCKTKVLRTTQLYVQDNYQTLLRLHRKRFNKISELAARKSGNYVLMSPNRNTFNIANSTYLNPNPQTPFENVILNHNQGKNVSSTVSKAIDAVIVACKTPVHTNTFSNEPISFRSPKLCAEIKLEKERKAKLLSQQQQQQQNNNQSFNNTTSNANVKQANQNNQQPQAKSSPNNSQTPKSVTITQTQQAISTASPSSPTVSNLLSSNQILAKSAANTTVQANSAAIRSNLTTSQGGASNVVKSPQQPPMGTYFQGQQQQQQRNMTDLTSNSNSPGQTPVTVSISRANSTVFPGQPPLRFFASKLTHLKGFICFDLFNFPFGLFLKLRRVSVRSQ